MILSKILPNRFVSKKKSRVSYSHVMIYILIVSMHLNTRQFLNQVFVLNYYTNSIVCTQRWRSNHSNDEKMSVRVPADGLAPPHGARLPVRDSGTCRLSMAVKLDACQISNLNDTNNRKMMAI